MGRTGGSSDSGDGCLVRGGRKRTPARARIQSPDKMAFSLSSRSAGFTAVSVKQTRVARAGRASALPVNAAKKEAVVVLTGTAGVAGTVTFTQDGDGEMVLFV